MYKQLPDILLSGRRLALGVAVLAAGCWGPVLQADTAVDTADLFSQISHSIPLQQSGAGSFTVSATVGGVETEFLLDTGASMATVTASLFKQIRRQGKVTRVRRVGARLASGKVEVLDVYQVQHFSVGSNCELGPLEVAVLNRGGRNLLGMNVLQQAAPFAISMSPPLLALSRCGLKL